VTRDDLVAHCAALPGAWLDEPWDGDVVVKVGSKIFAFVGSPAPAEADPVAGGSVGVTCGRTREEADEWLHRYPDDAGAMAYIGRFGWNTLRFRRCGTRRRGPGGRRLLVRRDRREAPPPRATSS
jgi:hypothetical protein